MELLCPECRNAQLGEVIYNISPDFPIVAGYACPSCKYYISIKDMKKIEEEYDRAEAEYDARCGEAENEREAEEQYIAEMEEMEHYEG